MYEYANLGGGIRVYLDRAARAASCRKYFRTWRGTSSCSMANIAPSSPQGANNVQWQCCVAAAGSKEDSIWSQQCAMEMLCRGGGVEGGFKMLWEEWDHADDVAS